MLYDTYQVHSDVLAPIRLMAEFFRGVLTQPWPLIENAPLVRSAAAARASADAQGWFRCRFLRHATAA